VSRPEVPHHPAALRVWWSPDSPAHLLTSSWPKAAAQAAAWLRHGRDAVLLEWVPCAVSPLGQLVPLTTADGPPATSVSRAWVLVELDATGAVVARPSSASSGVL
jgi:hypothetical protein